VATEDEGWCSFTSCTPSRSRARTSYYCEWNMNETARHLHDACVRHFPATLPSTHQQSLTSRTFVGILLSWQLKLITFNSNALRVQLHVQLFKTFQKLDLQSFGCAGLQKFIIINTAAEEGCTDRTVMFSHCWFVSCMSVCCGQDYSKRCEPIFTKLGG